jgi:hypothetical protein
VQGTFQYQYVFRELSALTGIAPALAAEHAGYTDLSRSGIAAAYDLLYRGPDRFNDRRFFHKLCHDAPFAAR